MDDLISRQAAIDAFMTSTSDGDKAEWCKWVLEQLPSAERRGRWEYREEYKGSKGGYYYCSLCEMASWASDSPFCPNCGAKMDEVNG